MTTIVAADGKIAADRRRVGPHLCTCTKVWEAPDGTIFADAGDAAWGEVFKEWYCSGAKPDRRDALGKLMHDMGGDYIALQVLRDKTIVLWSVPFMPLPMHTTVYGVGSGSPYALGAFSAGKSLQEAITIASQWDECTSAESDIIALPLKRKRRG